MSNKLLFLDSFVFIRMAEDTNLATAVKSYIISNEYTLIIGVMNLIEVYKWQKYWAQVCDFVASVPFCVAQNSEQISETEVSKYPDKIDLPTAFCSSDYSFSKTELEDAIEVNLRNKISSFEKHYRINYRAVWESILNNRNSFPPDENGQYSPAQRWLFLQTNVLKWLYPYHRDFLKQNVSASKEIKIECFKSVYIQMLAIFLEYYVQRKDGKPSDLGDFSQLSVLPYVAFAVFDNERYDLIQRINRQNLFPETLPGCNLAQFRKVI